MIRALALCLLAVLAGCSDGETPSQAPPAEAGISIDAEPAERTLDRTDPAPPSLVGEYRVAGVDDDAVDMGWAMTVSIDDATIRLVSQCVTPLWSYDWDGRRLATESLPIPICERGRAPEEEAAIAAFDSATRVERTPENGLRFEGGKHSVTLFSQ